MEILKNDGWYEIIIEGEFEVEVTSRTDADDVNDYAEGLDDLIFDCAEELRRAVVTSVREALSKRFPHSEVDDYAVDVGEKTISIYASILDEYIGDLSDESLEKVVNRLLKEVDEEVEMEKEFDGKIYGYEHGANIPDVGGVPECETEECTLYGHAYGFKVV